jgi:hypothetical protein
MPATARYVTTMASGGGVYQPGDKVNVKVDTQVYECRRMAAGDSRQTAFFTCIRKTGIQSPAPAFSAP